MPKKKGKNYCGHFMSIQSNSSGLLHPTPPLRFSTANIAKSETYNKLKKYEEMHIIINDDTFETIDLNTLNDVLRNVRCVT